VDTARSGQSDSSERLLEAMPDAIVMVAMDGRVARVNRRAEALSGYTRDELVGMNVEQLVPQALRAAHLTHRTAYQRSPAVRSMGAHLDIRFRRKDGSEFPADIALSPVTTEAGVLVVAAVRDITERRQAEQDLVHAQESFRLVVEGVRDYAILMLDPDGMVRSWSPAATDLQGYGAAEILGRHFSIFYTEADREDGGPARDLAAAAGTGHLEVEGWRHRKDGSRFWASVVLSSIRSGAGKLLGFAMITRDITEHKREDDRLRAVLEIAQATLEGRDEAELLELVAERARTLVGSGTAMVVLPDAVLDSPGVAAAGRREGPDIPGLTVRLQAGARVLGDLVVTGEPGGEPYTDGDRQLLDLFAAQAAVAIEYSRARGDLERLAVLDDRERIGRELHDGAIQALFAVGMSLQGTAISTADSALRERLEGTVGRIDEVIRDLRNYIFGLRPGLAADRQLGLALQELADQLEEQHGVACAVDVDPAVAALLTNRAGDVVQVAREALSNVGRHAGAATCRLSLRVEDGLAVLEVEDDGRGFVPAANGGGWGLRNLSERATAMGGSLEVASVPGEGTTVSLRVPM
jgi:PAS domain S-box-containing protein